MTTNPSPEEGSSTGAPRSLERAGRAKGQLYVVEGPVKHRYAFKHPDGDFVGYVENALEADTLIHRAAVWQRTGKREWTFERYLAGGKRLA